MNNISKNENIAGKTYHSVVEQVRNILSKQPQIGTKK
jgi:hypothetical protein